MTRYAVLTRAIRKARMFQFGAIALALACAAVNLYFALMMLSSIWPAIIHGIAAISCVLLVVFYSRKQSMIVAAFRDELAWLRVRLTDVMLGIHPQPELRQ